MHAFRQAVDARDLDAVAALLAPDVVFRSPVAHTPYQGRALTAAILRAVIEVFEDFHYVREIEDADGHEHALVFTARVDGLELTGCDFLTLDDRGQITELMVMVRPLRAAEALAARMGERFEQIQASAGQQTS